MQVFGRVLFQVGFGKVIDSHNQEENGDCPQGARNETCFWLVGIRHGFFLHFWAENGYDNLFLCQKAFCLLAGG